MTLFCYGAIELKSDPDTLKKQLLQIADDLSWDLDFTDLQQKFTLDRLFNFREDFCHNLLVYEVITKTNNFSDLNKELYADYGGDIMVQHYREIAKNLNISNWQNLEFGSLEEVDTTYKISPANFPLIQFLDNLLERFPECLSVLCLNQDFDFADKASEIIGTKNDLRLEIWKTIAYGYSWPHIRLIHDPCFVLTSKI